MYEFRQLSDEEYQKVRTFFLKAVDDIVGHARRSLLDTLDQAIPRESPAAGMLRKRIHNDIPIIASQIKASYMIVENGGIVPPFGREEPDAGKTDAQRRSQARQTA